MADPNGGPPPTNPLAFPQPQYEGVQYSHPAPCPQGSQYQIAQYQYQPQYSRHAALYLYPQHSSSAASPNAYVAAPPASILSVHPRDQYQISSVYNTQPQNSAVDAADAEEELLEELRELQLKRRLRDIRKAAAAGPLPQYAQPQPMAEASWKPTVQYSPPVPPTQYQPQPSSSTQHQKLSSLIDKHEDRMLPPTHDPKSPPQKPKYQQLPPPPTSPPPASPPSKSPSIPIPALLKPPPKKATPPTPPSYPAREATPPGAVGPLLGTGMRFIPSKDGSGWPDMVIDPEEMITIRFGGRDRLVPAPRRHVPGLTGERIREARRLTEMLPAVCADFRAKFKARKEREAAAEAAKAAKAAADKEAADKREYDLLVEQEDMKEERRLEEVRKWFENMKTRRFGSSIHKSTRVRREPRSSTTQYRSTRGIEEWHKLHAKKSEETGSIQKTDHAKADEGIGKDEVNTRDEKYIGDDEKNTGGDEGLDVSLHAVEQILL